MDVWRAVLPVPSPAREGAGLRPDHLNGGQVRVQWTLSGEGVRDWFCATLEDVGPFAATRVLECVVWEVPNPRGAAREPAGGCRARKERSLCQ